MRAIYDKVTTALVFFIILYVVANAFMSGLGKHKNSISIHLTSYFPASYPGVLVPRPGVPRHQGQAAQELRARQVHLAQVVHLDSSSVSLAVHVASAPRSLTVHLSQHLGQQRPLQYLAQA